MIKNAFCFGVILTGMLMKLRRKKASNKVRNDQSSSQKAHTLFGEYMNHGENIQNRCRNRQRFLRCMTTFLPTHDDRSGRSISMSRPDAWGWHALQAQQGG